MSARLETEIRRVTPGSRTASFASGMSGMVALAVNGMLGRWVEEDWRVGGREGRMMARGFKREFIKVRGRHNQVELKVVICGSSHHKGRVMEDAGCGARMGRQYDSSCCQSPR